MEAHEELRPYLFAIAYRMLGSVADAEDVVQEAFLHYHAAETEADSPKAYLATVTTRLAIDQLRSARSRRETYPGDWLPEPLVDDEAARHAEMSDSDPGLVFYESDGRALWVAALEITDGIVVAGRSVLNPYKLGHVAPR